MCCLLFQGKKYVIASQSIEHPKCPPSPSVIRGQVCILMYKIAFMVLIDYAV